MSASSSMGPSRTGKSYSGADSLPTRNSRTTGVTKMCLATTVAPSMTGATTTSGTRTGSGSRQSKFQLSTKSATRYSSRAPRTRTARSSGCVTRGTGTSGASRSRAPSTRRPSGSSCYTRSGVTSQWAPVSVIPSSVGYSEYSQQDEEAIVMVPMNDQKKSKCCCIASIIIGAIVLILGIWALWFFFIKEESNGDQPNQSSTTTTQQEILNNKRIPIETLKAKIIETPKAKANKSSKRKPVADGPDVERDVSRKTTQLGRLQRYGQDQTLFKQTKTDSGRGWAKYPMQLNGKEYSFYFHDQCLPKTNEDKAMWHGKCRVARKDTARSGIVGQLVKNGGKDRFNRKICLKCKTPC